MAAANDQVVRAVAFLPPAAVQEQLLLLRMCASPLTTYALRFLAPAAATALAAQVNATIQGALLLLRAADDRQDTRRALLACAAHSVRIGGLGLGDRSVVVPAAHVASWLATLRATGMSVPVLRELARALSAPPAITASGQLAVGAARTPTTDEGGDVLPSNWGGKSAWPGAAVAASAAAPPPLAPPLAAAPMGAPMPASLAASSAEGGLWGPLLPCLQACLATCVSKATSPTEGSLGTSPFESVAPPSTDPLLSLTLPLNTANIQAAGLPRALRGISNTWRALLDAPTRLMQLQLANAAHLAAARAMWAPLPMSARARWAAGCGPGSGLWLNRLSCGGSRGGALAGPEMAAAVRLWLGGTPIPQACARECRRGTLADRTEVLQRVAAALRVDPRWTGVVAEPPLPVGTQAPALRPDLRATRVSSGAPLWGDVSVAASTAAAHVSGKVSSPRMLGAAWVREAEQVGNYTPHLPAGDPPHTFTPLVWEACGRVGPDTGSFHSSAPGAENHREALTGLLADVSLMLWRWNARTGLA